MKTTTGDGPEATPWQDVQRDYEERLNLTVDAICERYGITRAKLYAAARRWNWKRRAVRRAARPGRTRPLARLKHLVERRIESLEAGAAMDGSDPPDDALIARMTALLKLIERIATLEQKERSAERAATPQRVVNDARRLELARRIEAIQRQLELERARGPAEEKGAQ
jgi:hypothetical protein